MAYSFIKAKGRVAIIKDGEFNHQQFRGHWAYGNPEGYIAHLIKRDEEAAEYLAEVNAARTADALEYLTKRAARVAAQPSFEF